MQNWDDHRLLLAIHRGGTLRAAADNLNVAHTTVARRLAAMEAKQAVPLFTRSGRTLKITDYGLQCVAIAEKMESLDFASQRLHQSATETLSGPLSLSVPRPFLMFTNLLTSIDEFGRAHPEIDLTLVGSDSLADLDRRQADVVLRGQIGPDAHLVGRRLSHIGLQFYASRSYLDTTPPENYRWITPPSKSGTGPTWLPSSPFPDAPVKFVIDDIISRHKAVADGLGLGRLACFMAEQNPELVAIGQADPVPAYDLWILTHPDLRENNKIKAIMQCLWDGLRPQKDLLQGRPGQWDER